MNIRKVIDNYVECNEFEIKIINNKVKVFYYDKIIHFSQNKISILKRNKKIDIEGKNLVIETMFDELIIISGNIEKIALLNTNEKFC